MSEYNMTHTGKELDDAIAKVQSGYVPLKTYYDTYTPPSDTANISVDLGFNPKGVAIITRKSIARSSSYSYLSSWVWENVTGTVRQSVNYVCGTFIENSSDGVTQGAGTGSFPSGVSGTTFTWNLSESTATAYKFRFKGGAIYYIYAWGY